MNRVRIIVVALLVICTVTECNSLRTRTNTLRVQRVRRLDEAGE